MESSSSSLSFSGQEVHWREDGWTLEAEGLRLGVAPPELHGTVGREGSKGPSCWRARLAFSGAARTAQSVEVPNLGALPGLVIAGRACAETEAEAEAGTSRSPSPGPSFGFAFAWRMTVALSTEGLLLHLALELDEGAPANVELKHVCLAPMEVSARRDSAPDADPHRAGTETEQMPPCRAIYRFLLGLGGDARRTPEHSSFLVNGWQSFGFSGVLHGAVPQPRTSMQYFSGAFHVGASLPSQVAKADASVLVSDMFGLLWLHGTGGILSGFLGQEYAFGGLAVHSTMKPLQLLLFAELGVTLQPGSAASTDWAMIQVIPPSQSSQKSSEAGLLALQRYFAAVTMHKCVPPCKPQPVGWCSWYCHGTKVNDRLMAESLEAVVAARANGTLPLNLFQVDDGWQSAWGDWLSPHPERFPQGLQPLAAAIRRAGLVAGLWLAPAAVVARSAVAVEHPEWLLRDSAGRPVSCGFTAPGRWLLALDATRPEVLSHVARVVHTVVRDWGFDYLKLDFLHCAAMPGAQRFNKGVSRAAALAGLLAAIREAAGDEAYLLACGAPLGPCVGHVDAIRVSADTAEHWLPKVLDLPGLRGFFERDETNLPAARNMVRSTLARLPMHRVLWNNDPDCLILREEVPLSEAQARATVAAFSAGSLIFSDSLDRIPAERLDILKVLLPPLPCGARRIDFLSGEIPSLLAMELDPREEAAEMGPWHLVALFRWVSTPDVLETELPMPTATADGEAEKARAWHVFEFWTGSYELCVGTLAKVRCPCPRGCRLFALREVRPDVPQLVGSNVHVSCGLEVGRWCEAAVAAGAGAPEAAGVGAPEASTPRALQLSLKPARSLEAPRLWLQLPGAVAARPPRVRPSGGAGPSAPSEPALHISGDVWQLTLPRVDVGDLAPLHIEW